MNKIPRSIKPASSVLLYGVGSSASPFQWGAANKNGLGFWLRSDATSGDARAIYARLYFYGAGGGEALRAYGTVAASNVATGGTVNGAHISLSINTSSSVSGAGNALRATLDAAAATRTLTGTLAAIQVDSNFGANNTLPTQCSFLRFTNTGAVLMAKLMEIPAPTSGGLVAVHTTQVMSHSIRIIDAAGTLYYLMVTNTATNRTGGA